MSSNTETVVIYSKFITVKGKRIYAHQKGLDAFRLEIPKDKYKPRQIINMPSEAICLRLAFLFE